jgi:hypothetical protein
VDFSSGWNAVGVAAGDLDGDGRPELVFANAYDDNLTVYRNRTAEIGTNGPPLVRITTESPLEFLCEPGGCVVIDPLQAGATVRLDAGTCSDPEGDLLTYEWSIDGQVIGTDACLSHTLPLGSQTVTLRVSDGTHSAAATVTVEVITPVAAVESLIVMIADSELPAAAQQKIIAILEDTLTIIPHDPRRADTRLERARQRIRAALRRENPAAAALVIDALDQIIRAARCD